MVEVIGQITTDIVSQLKSSLNITNPTRTFSLSISTEELKSIQTTSPFHEYILNFLKVSHRYL